MRSACKIRDEYLSTLKHIHQSLNKMQKLANKKGGLTYPEAFKLAEGLFMNAWTYWEQFLRELLVTDLANDPNGVLCSEIKKFRVKLGPYRIAERLLNHPDAPTRWVEWDYKNVQSRADSFLASGHRYPKKLKRNADLERIKKMRNAIAHGSDKAWSSFTEMVMKAPFKLSAKQKKGITVGRFVYGHKWNSRTVLEETIISLEDAARELVP